MKSPVIELLKIRETELSLYNRFEEILRLETAFVARDVIDKLEVIVQEKKTLMYKLNQLMVQGKKLRATIIFQGIVDEPRLKDIESRITAKLITLKEIEDSVVKLIEIKMASLQKDMNSFDKKKKIDKHFKSFAGYKVAKVDNSQFEVRI